MKKQLIIGLLMIVTLVFTQNVFAGNIINTDQTPTRPDVGTPIDGVEDVTKDAWATVVVVVRVMAVACVVFAGVRYMFASSDQKADIKQGLVYLAIGAVLVFGATYIINLVVDVTNETLL